jgi:hypothetical protein
MAAADQWRYHGGSRVDQLHDRLAGAPLLPWGGAQPRLAGPSLSGGGDRPEQGVYRGTIDTENSAAETVCLQFAAGDPPPNGVDTDRVAVSGFLD